MILFKEQKDIFEEFKAGVFLFIEDAFPIERKTYVGCPKCYAKRNVQEGSTIICKSKKCKNKRRKAKRLNVFALLAKDERDRKFTLYFEPWKFAIKNVVELFDAWVKVRGFPEGSHKIRNNYLPLIIIREMKLLYRPRNRFIRETEPLVSELVNDGVVLDEIEQKAFFNKMFTNINIHSQQAKRKAGNTKGEIAEKVALNATKKICLDYEFSISKIEYNSIYNGQLKKTKGYEEKIKLKEDITIGKGIGIEVETRTHMQTSPESFDREVAAKLGSYPLRIYIFINSCRREYVDEVKQYCKRYQIELVELPNPIPFQKIDDKVIFNINEIKYYIKELGPQCYSQLLSKFKEIELKYRQEIDEINTKTSSLFSNHSPSKAKHQKINFQELIAFSLMAKKYCNNSYRQAYSLYIDFFRLLNKIGYHKLLSRLKTHKEKIEFYINLLEQEHVEKPSMTAIIKSQTAIIKWEHSTSQNKVQ